MGEARKAPTFDRASYLQWEATQDTKNEYFAGEVFAMVGARREHVVVAGTVFAKLREHLKGSRCQTYVSDMKLFVEAADAYFYPDVMVSCDEHDRRADLFVEHPSLLVEVLSESTAAYDRGEKFAAYRKIESLREYLLVDIDHRRLELYRRAEGHWLMMETTDALPPLTLESAGLAVSAEWVFEDLVD
jgi:Uma2 family endonuclease